MRIAGTGILELPPKAQIDLSGEADAGWVSGKSDRLIGICFFTG
jgi:hypothetical protein